VQFLDDALLHDCNAGFLRGEIDQDFFRHSLYNARFCGILLWPKLPNSSPLPAPF
jgi:hypothetical protein